MHPASPNTATNRLSECPACTGSRWADAEVRNGYDLARCADCGLLFTLNPDYRPDRYVAAYEGNDDEAALPKELAHVYAGPQLRLELEGRAWLRPPPRLTRAERLALQWLRTHAPGRGVTVECGCGTGRFLRALKTAGLEGVGVELSEATVTALKRAGLQAIQGLAPDFSWSAPAPFAIAFFEVLEHLPEPRSIMAPLKQRFPSATIVASVPSPQRWPVGDKGPGDSPPHHYLSWTPKALERFFGNLGYSKVTVQQPPPVGYEQMPTCGTVLTRFKRFRPSFSPTATTTTASSPNHSATADHSLKQRLTATGKLWMLASFHLAVNVLGTPAARRAGREGYSAASMLVIAEP